MFISHSSSLYKGERQHFISQSEGVSTGLFDQDILSFLNHCIVSYIFKFRVLFPMRFNINMLFFQAQLIHFSCGQDEVCALAEVAKKIWH